MGEAEPAFVVTGFVTVLSLAWSPVVKEIFPTSVNQFVFHAVVLGALVILLALFRKSPLYRMFMVIAISHYMFAYPWESGCGKQLTTGAFGGPSR